MEILKENRLLKGYLFLLLTIVFINPIILFLLTENLYISVLFPILAITLFLIIWKISGPLRIKIYYFNLLFILSIVINTELIFTKCYYDYVIPNPYQIKNGYYFNKPNIYQQFSDLEYTSLYITNNQGFRTDKFYESNRSITSCDWLFLGDSFTQGAQVNYSDLFTSKVYRYFPNKIIVNAGISGFSIADEYNYYIKEGYLLRPKKVFLQLCIFNDFMNVHSGHIGLNEYLMVYSNLYRTLLYNIQYTDSKKLPLGRWTEPFSSNEQQNVDYNIFYKETSQRKIDDISNLEKYLALFKEATHSNGAELCVILIPTKEQISIDHFTEVIDSFNIDASKLDMYLPNNIMQSLSQKYKFELIDLLSNFSDGSGFPYFYQDEHLNVFGHQKVADAIFDKFNNEQNLYEYISLENDGDRYPTIIADEGQLLLQTLIDNKLQICISDTIKYQKEVLTSSFEDKLHPTISTDRNWISFTQGDQDIGNTLVMLMNRNNGITENILEDDQFGAIPAFSPCSRFLAYPSWRESNNIPIITLYNIESRQQKLLTDPDIETWRPVFSQDGQYIYYLARQTNGFFAIKSINMVTYAKETILKTNYDIWDIAISKDNRIVYSGRKNNNWDLFIIDLKTKKINQLTHTDGDEWDASFGVNNDLWFAGTFGFNNGVFRMKLK